jgi:hypothetical protein
MVLGALAGCTQPAEHTLSDALTLCIRDGPPATITQTLATDTQRGTITRTRDGTRVAYFIDATPDRDFILAEGPPLEGPSGTVRDVTWKDGAKGFALERTAVGRNVFVVFRYSGQDAGQRSYALALARSVTRCSTESRSP